VRVQGGRGGLKEGAGVLGVRATGRAGEISGEMLGGSCASGIRRKRMALARGAGPSAGGGRDAGEPGVGGGLTSGARWQAGGGRAGLDSGERTGPGLLSARGATREQAGMEPGRVRGGTGPAREEKKKRVGRLAEVVGRNGFWIFWVWVRFFYFLFSFLFLLQIKFEFKYKFEFKPHSNKSMHQHECNNKNLNL